MSEIYRVGKYSRKIYRTLVGAMRAARGNINEIQVAKLDWKQATHELVNSRTKYVILNKTDGNYLNKRGQATFLRFAYQYGEKWYAEQEMARFKTNRYLYLGNKELEVKEITISISLEE